MRRKRKTHMSISDTDVTFVFKESGHVDVSFPEITTDPVPDHVLAALAISYAITDPQTLQTLRTRFANHQLLNSLKKASNDS